MDQSDEEEDKPHRHREPDSAEEAPASQEESSSEDDQAEHNEAAEAGIVEKIELQNFMCHSNFQLQLGPHVNFIVGSNGSGKSAVLVALTVCLGASAKFTNRSSNMGQLVMRGKSSALVSVSIKNCGSEAYKPEEYGNVIVVERRIRADGGSSYAIKNAKGKVVSTKRSELKLMLEVFNIQIDNPCSILMQDTSREFLNKFTPKNKYKFFLLATELQQIKLNFDYIAAQVTYVESTVQRKSKGLAEIKAQTEELKKELEEHRRIQGLSEEIQTLNSKLVWLYAKETEESVRKIEEKIAEWVGMEEKIKGKISEKDEEREKVREMSQKNFALVTEMQKQTSHVQEELGRKHDERRLLNTDKQKIDAEINSIKTRISQDGKRRKRVEEYINQQQAQEVDKIKKINEQKKAKIEQNLLEIQTIMKKVEEIAIEKKETDENIRKIEEALSNLRNEMKQKEHKIEGLKKKSSDLVEAKKDRARLFGPDTIKIQELIAKHKSSFNSPPIGPIGLLIQVSDPQWVIAVESALHGYLEAYICTNTQDTKYFVELIKRERLREPTILECAFTHLVYQIPKEDRPDTYTVLDMIKSPNAVVINCIIDQARIEKKALAENYDMAIKLAFNERNRTIQEVIDKEGTKYTYRNGTQDIKAYGKHSVSKLAVTTDEQIENIGKQIEIIAKDRVTNENEYKGLQTQYSNLKVKKIEVDKEYHSTQRPITKLQAEIESLKVMEREEPPVDIESIKENISRINSEIEKHEAELKEEEEKMKVVKDKLAAINNEIKEKEAEGGEVGKKVKEIEESLEMIAKAQKALKEGHQKNIERLAKVKKFKDEEEEKKKSFLVQLEQTRAKAQELCKEEDVKFEQGDTSDSVKKLIQQKQKTLEHRSQSKRKLEEVEEDYKSAVDKCNTLNAHLQNAFTIKENISKCLQQRKKHWNTLLQTATRKTKSNFNVYLSQKGHSGELIFDHEKQTLNISVKLSNSNSEGQNSTADTMSGGERSYSTVSLLLSLWEVMELPFYAMDEFDVFMDAVNRHVSIDMLVSTGLRHKNKQYIFITPHNSASIPVGKYVKIHKMSPPRKQS